MVEKTPRSMRIHIGVFGRTNTGKSSLINYIVGQNISIVSSLPGTTTDIVEKSMELLPLGPVLLIDTAGINDGSEIGSLRVEKTKKVFDRVDFGLVVTSAGEWGEYEEGILSELEKRGSKPIIIINKIDLKRPDESFLNIFKSRKIDFIECSTKVPQSRDEFLDRLKKILIENRNEERYIIRDLVSQKTPVVLIIPIDKEAPKGRLILPQAQVIRELLDNSNVCVVLKEGEYEDFIRHSFIKPELVVCDSQIVKFMVDKTPSDIKCTTFSILFSRFKGDMKIFVKGVREIPRLSDGDRVGILEACSHHPNCDDIGRVKLPSWIKKATGKNIKFEFFSGRDFPDNLSDYRLLIHCGGCMLNFREVLARQNLCLDKGIAVTNYGMAISYCLGVIERVLEPFPEMLDIYKESDR